MSEINKILQYILENNFTIIEWNYSPKFKTFDTHIYTKGNDDMVYVALEKEIKFEDFKNKVDLVIKEIY